MFDPDVPVSVKPIALTFPLSVSFPVTVSVPAIEVFPEVIVRVPLFAISVVPPLQGNVTLGTSAVGKPTGLLVLCGQILVVAPYIIRVLPRIIN